MTTPHPTRKRTTWISNFGVQVIIGLIVGLVLGFIARKNNKNNDWLTNALEAIGDTYVQLLKLLIPLLVFTAVVTSIANLRKVTNAARLAVSTLMWFAITAFFSVVAGIIVALLIKPGENTTIDPSNAADPSKVGSWFGFLESIVPVNFLGLSASATDSGAININFNVLQILILSLAIGIAAIQSGKAAEPFFAFNESLLAIIQKVLWWIIRLAPVGTAALIAHAIASYGWEALGSLGKFVIAVYLGLALVLGIIYPAVLRFARIPVIGFYRRIAPVTSLGFVTRSSMGVMPVTQRVSEQALGVPREYASFAIPLGATTKMDGCAAVYPAVAAIFVSQFYGVSLDFTDYLLIIFVSVIGSAATAGTTGATVMLTLTLSTLGLPLAGVGLLLAVEPIIDMGRTAVNVTGQALVAAVVSKRAGILNEQVWNHD
ncbi:dicarboxylate/amino acid:cation symporter [Corynebacterium sp. sy039]|uniref:dicarboxylate/amino acid:cation symporter n=1 Tax=Corynebacterium sp. sy039 TaxID=2599641 RepID=UPI0011B4881E|nr:dicarboxylate/amino acid:cation symporter [Corynebacterium sp. sy039]QDZ42221.1 dicarboxylate/amino acid:cation symporter [Corynebacterium sp. sy039]